VGVPLPALLREQPGAGNTNAQEAAKAANPQTHPAPMTGDDRR
jgi:hypothetical protein